MFHQKNTIMNLKEIAALSVSKSDKTVETGAETSLKNDAFREHVKDAIINQIHLKSRTCVFFPSYQDGKKELGQLINELALSSDVCTIATGAIQNLNRFRNNGNIKEVILVKQFFRTGNELSHQIAQIKEMNFHVNVMCVFATSEKELKAFAEANNVEASALFYSDEL